MCVTDFTCILLENQVHTGVCFSVSSKSFYKNTLLQSIFAASLVVLGPFWQYEEFNDRYPKKPISCQSLKKTSVTIIIKAIITAYDSTAQDLAAKIN